MQGVDFHEQSDKQPADFYDQQYYKSRYGKVLDSPEYYHLLSQHWKYSIFSNLDLDPEKPTLDYGCGLGQVSAALSNVTFFDPSNFANAFLRSRNRIVVNSPDAIPKHCFDYLISSHSLEHSPTPVEDLRRFHEYLTPTGKLILVLPIETKLNPTLEPDFDQHFQCWTFQTITNLLCYCGWQPLKQTYLYHPFLLKSLGLRTTIPENQAVRISAWLGQLKKAYPSLLILSKKREME